MPVALFDRPVLQVTRLRHVGPYGAPVAAFWQQVVFPWLIANGRLGRQPLYGVSYDNPLTTDPAQCRYDVAIECPAPRPAPVQKSPQPPSSAPGHRSEKVHKRR